MLSNDALLSRARENEKSGRKVTEWTRKKDLRDWLPNTFSMDFDRGLNVHSSFPSFVCFSCLSRELKPRPCGVTHETARISRWETRSVSLRLGMSGKIPLRRRQSDIFLNLTQCSAYLIKRFRGICISLASVSTKMSTLLGLSTRQTVRRDSPDDVRDINCAMTLAWQKFP